MDVMMVAVVRLNMQYTCTALSMQTSHLRGSFRLLMLCIKAAHSFNTHNSPQCSLIHTHTLNVQIDVMRQYFPTSEQFGLYFDPFKKPKSSPDISIKEPDR